MRCSQAVIPTIKAGAANFLDGAGGEAPRRFAAAWKTC